MKRSLFGIAFYFLMVAAASGQNPAALEPNGSHFYWSIRKAHFIAYERTIQKSLDLNSAEKSALTGRISSLIRPFMKENEIESEAELRKIAANTRVELMDLDGDGVPEIVAQANDTRAGCGAAGNCPFWIFKKTSEGYKLILDTRDKDGIGGAELITIEDTLTNGFRDLVLAAHDSASEETLIVLRYRNGMYRETACYDAN